MAVHQPPVAAGGRPRAVPGRAGGDARRRHGRRLHPHLARRPAARPRHERDLLDAYFEPYAAAMTAAVQDRLAATGRAVVIDVHSYPAAPLPYELHGGGPRPAVCLGTDAFHTPAWLLDAAREAFAPCGEIGLDSPFAGTYVPLKHYGEVREVSALMVEIRRDGYMTEPGGAPGEGVDRLGDALTALVAAVGTGDGTG
ncbi:N-formylglutamate amidohydrolase [Actinacidiphila glaucinigra]|nr:N-formylglutamate amidohydrolase [Actinacidiphila glaucinigra]